MLCLCRYSINAQVCLAVNIPNDQNLNNLAEVFAPTTAVWETQRAQVYVSNGELVAAIPYRNAHAESRVLNNMNSLINKANNHFLVFYSFYSPCYGTCTNVESTYTIIPRINEIIPNWKGQHAFVFSSVFERTSKGAIIDQNQTKQALLALANSEIGFNNIFRCYKPGDTFQCIRCFNDENPVQQCLVN